MSATYLEEMAKKAQRGERVPSILKDAGHLAKTIVGAVEAATRPLHTRLQAAERRIAQLDQQLKDVDRGIIWKGVWGASEQYPQGVFVTSGGSIWHSERASIGRKPGSDPNYWKLACKKGADGKDAK